jgi:hypothetical protein
MWQHCNNISFREYRTELDVDGIQQIDGNNDKDVFRFTVTLRLRFMLIKGYMYLLYILIGEGFSFELHSLLTAGRILTFEVSN